MMWYMIVATDVDNSADARASNHDAHLKRLQVLKQADRLLMAGHNPMLEHDSNISGELIVAKFQDLDDAQQWVENDPFALEGVYTEVLIKPYIPIY